ncbi:hypothetical protein Hdeb2414_s0016g00485721 [Helianthus debilis subsp. tardiflorus]
MGQAGEALIVLRRRTLRPTVVRYALRCCRKVARMRLIEEAASRLYNNKRYVATQPTTKRESTCTGVFMPRQPEPRLSPLKNGDVRPFYFQIEWRRLSI